VIDPAGSHRPSRVAGWLAAVAAPPTATVGARLALEPGRGRTAVPVRAALAGAVAAVCILTAAAAFGASLARLARSPAAYGVSWDAAVGNFASAAAGEPVAARLQRDPEVAATAGLLSYLEAVVDGRPALLLSMEERKGSLSPAVIEGREPLRPDEIALGSITLRSVGRKVGDTVTVAVERRPAQRVRVLGWIVLNAPGNEALISPGRGGLVHPVLFRRLFPEPALVYPSTYLVRLDARADRERAIARLRRQFPGEMMLTPRPHLDVQNFQRLAGLPDLFASLVALLALGTMTHTLVTSVRRRRRDLAVLKTLGFTRRQVAATIAWQATTFAVVALCLGLPLGVAAGRWAWQLTAGALGVSSASVVPLVVAVVVAAGAVVAANLVAAMPGRAASRLRPASALRSE
jgi:hypothetical protein